MIAINSYGGHNTSALSALDFTWYPRPRQHFNYQLHEGKVTYFFSSIFGTDFPPKPRMFSSMIKIFLPFRKMFVPLEHKGFDESFTPIEIEDELTFFPCSNCTLVEIGSKCSRRREKYVIPTIKMY